MPYIPVTCPSGSHEFFYSISTPTESSAEKIQEGLPTILFIHSGWYSQQIYESQFTDPHIRQFNLIVIDNLGNGSTRGKIGDQRYTPKEVAKDLRCVLDALGLPPAHIFGLSLGAIAALELAIAYPECVLSLTLCSPVSLTEPEHIAAGRMQVYKCWEAAFAASLDPKDPETKQKQQDYVEEALLGVTQLLFNNVKTRLIKALLVHQVLQGVEIWSGTEENLKQSYDACVRCFIEREAIPTESFAKIKCPVSIIHCTEDIGYTMEHKEELANKLTEAGVKVTLHTVPGPHFALLEGYENINPILVETVLGTDGGPKPPTTLPKPDYRRGKMKTPWTEALQEHGYLPDDPAGSNDMEDAEIASWFERPRVLIREERTVVTEVHG
ncbi:hypothetical protein EST38_g9023 [Candolleomyces aberdarensis]|uniref:AB hydrolase-1 domain-containing protein n=1 Tax=Candolleomyces aberdarensis TaxID=2316362 RepID=A0A4Q2DBU0_9AGAR|nr:hypothetical protein EST38_g9023 [Candolleomyces aberdarensis]